VKQTRQAVEAKIVCFTDSKVAAMLGIKYYDSGYFILKRLRDQMFETYSVQ